MTRLIAAILLTAALAWSLLDSPWFVFPVAVVGWVLLQPRRTS